MRDFLVGRDARGWRYKERSFAHTSWNYFDNSVTDYKSIKNFFMRGNYDTPRLEFVTQDLKPAMIFEVKETPRREALINGNQESRTLPDFELIPIKQISQFYRDRSPQEVIEKGDTIQADFERIKYYRDSAPEIVLEQYKAWSKEKINETTITDYLRGFAQSRGLEAEVYTLKGTD